jgi:hypothetical protein
MGMGKEVYAAGAMVSIVVSLALYLKGRREAGIFVGLWAPTILLLGELMVEEEKPVVRRGLLRRDA